MNLRSFKVNRVFGPAQYIKMQATFPEVEFLRILFRFKKRKDNSSSYVYVLHKRQISKFHVVVVQWTSKRCIKKRDARAELLFWSLNLLFFWSRRCGRRRSCLSSLLFSAPNQNRHDAQVNLHQSTFPRPD